MPVPKNQGMRAIRTCRWILSGAALQYSKFCIVGASGAVIDMFLFHILVSPEYLHWNLTVGKILSAEAAMLINFLLNDVWTFRVPGRVSDDWRARVTRLWRYHLICSAGVVLSICILKLQVHGLGWNVHLANFQSIVVVSFWNYCLNRRFGWVLASPLKTGRSQDRPDRMEVGGCD